MPAIAAHYFFGQQVYAALPKEVKEVILPYREMFNLGLQGPDILFFYKPYLGKNTVSTHGNAIHQQEGSSFFTADKGCTKSGLSYMLGCVCHFCLDKNCHPYVIEKAPKITHHHRLESELDTLVIEKNRYPTAKHTLLPRAGVDFGAVAQAYGLDYKAAHTSYKDFLLYSNILGHRRLVKTLETLVGQGGRLSCISPQHNLLWQKDTGVLYKMLLDSVRDGVDMAEKYFNFVVYKEPELSGFNANFSGVVK